MQRSCSLVRRLLTAAPRRLPPPATRSLRSTAGPHRATKHSGAPRDGSSLYQLQGRIPSTYDKKVLLWAGRFKKEQDIPEIVSIEMLFAARNKIRVQVCYLMIIISIVGCVVMVISGKKASKKHENLTKWNLEKKAKLKEEYEQEHRIATEKAQ